MDSQPTTPHARSRSPRMTYCQSWQRLGPISAAKARYPASKSASRSFFVKHGLFLGCRLVCRISNGRWPCLIVSCEFWVTPGDERTPIMMRRRVLSVRRIDPMFKSLDNTWRGDMEEKVTSPGEELVWQRDVGVDRASLS